MGLLTDTGTLLQATRGVSFIYGTAWKRNETERLVGEAIKAGFKAFDTAAQPRHYQEDLVGSAFRKAFREGLVTREQLFVQTKFTSPQGQDARNKPYDFSDPLDVQIRTSVASSLRNLRAREELESESSSYIDCLLLHSPLHTPKLTLQAWKIMESFVPTKARHLGISNVPLPMLKSLLENAEVKPAVVQNRFYAETGYDTAIRQICEAEGIVYESFWTLTGNKQFFQADPVVQLSSLVGTSQEVAIYALVMGLGCAVLNGTTSQERMVHDLEHVKLVQAYASQHPEKWQELLESFEGRLQVR